MSSRLVVITPCRDELAFARVSIDSMLAQTRRPDRWVLVDDGSNDGTSELLFATARAHSWVSVVQRGDRGRRSAAKDRRSDVRIERRGASRDPIMQTTPVSTET